MAIKLFLMECFFEDYKQQGKNIGHKKRTNHYPSITNWFSVFCFMSGIRESNPPPRLGKPMHYRCANSAFLFLSRYRDSNPGPIHYE